MTEQSDSAAGTPSHETPGTGGAAPKGRVDPRGPRVNAGITAGLTLLGTYLALVGPPAGAPRIVEPGFLVLLAVAALFAWFLVSARTHPVSVLFRAVIRPRLAPPSEWEDARPPRFAQGVGLVVVGAGLVLHLLGLPGALAVAGAAAFVAAFLNAAFGFCLGCELYLLLVRAGLLRRSAA